MGAKSRMITETSFIPTTQTKKIPPAMNFRANPPMHERCPACFHFSTFSYPKEFRGCENCKTIFAINRNTTVKYDKQYVAERYEKYTTTKQMSHLRFTILKTVLYLYDSIPTGDSKVKPSRLLDIGFGNGDFIRTASANGWECYGNDVNPTEYKGVKRVELPNSKNCKEKYRVISFFDALEHFEDLSEARIVSHHTDWIFLSFPAVPNTFPFDLNFRHYRPGEHHLFFDPQGLEKIFSHGNRIAKLMYMDTPEDSIRTRWNLAYPNIWTCALRCSDGM